MTAATVNPADDAPHLLVVDDDRRIRALLSRFLVGEGYRVSTAETALEARATLESLKFDLLILDVMMPGENGFDLARAIPVRLIIRDNVVLDGLAGVARDPDRYAIDIETRVWVG